jgi:hypothetical protein
VPSLDEPPEPWDGEGAPGPPESGDRPAAGG